MRIDWRVVQARWLMEIGHQLRDEYTAALEGPGPVLEELCAKLRRLEASETQPETRTMNAMG